MRIGFLGAGKMATALCTGILDEGLAEASEMAACDISPAARDAFAAATGVRCGASCEESLSDCDVLILAVKPQAARAAAAPLAPLPASVLVISIAAGLRLSRLEEWLGTARIIRVMPNTPLMVGRGATVLCRGAAAREADAAWALRLFSALGTAYELDEAHLDAVTALSGSGPAYVFEFVRVLTEAGVSVGLPGEIALSLSVQTLAGAAEMLVQGKGSPEDLRRAVTSPGGTTAAGLAVLERHGFPALMAEAVAAARDRSIELGC